MKKRKKFTMKGYRNSPYNATDYDNLTEAEKEALARKFRAEDEANTQRDKSLAAHNASDDTAPSAF